MARVDADHPHPGNGVPSPGVAGLDPHHLAFLLHWVRQSGGRLVIELGPSGDRTSIEVRPVNATAGRAFHVEWQQGGAIIRRSASDASPEVLAAELVALVATSRLPHARPTMRIVADDVPEPAPEDDAERRDTSFRVTPTHVHPPGTRGPVAMSALMVAALAVVVVLALLPDPDLAGVATITGVAPTFIARTTSQPTAPPAARRPLRTPDTRELVPIWPVAGPPVRASGSRPDHGPDRARDGDPATAWVAGSEDETWLELDLGTSQTVSGIGLVVDQARAAPSLHRILVAADGDRYRIVHYFGQLTADGDALVYRPQHPIRSVRYVRIETMSGPPGSGWREVTILTP
jgi:hypothetical protein